MEENKIKENYEIVVNEREVTEEPVKKVESTNRGPGRKYSGPLQLFLDEPAKTSDIIDFKKFIDGLGQSGVTYEEFFERLKNYDDENFTRSVSTHKLFQLRSKGFLAYKWIELFADVLGYQTSIVFTPKPTTKILDGKYGEDDFKNYNVADLTERENFKGVDIDE